jgi:MFS superfamily sulfate permease-like transporter
MSQVNKNTNAPEFGFAGLKKYFKDDILSGFLVFLVALPLCLGISMASGFPPIGGIFTAIIGGMLVPLIAGKKNAQLTIKGPAAGLIAIAIACVTDLGNGDPLLGYKLALAVVVITGLIQIVFGVLKLGNFSDFFPISVVHGMLSAIGLIIILKQFPAMLGVKPAGKDMMALIGELPTTIANINYEIALIGFVSLAILIILPRINNKYVKMIPAPMVVILVSIPMGMYFDLEHEHVYLFQHHQFHVGPNFLVTLPGKMADAISFPDFSQVFSGTSIKYIIMFALVGSLETLISAKAVDMLDPFKRKTNFNRDLIAVGAGNTLAGFIGGLPMISEIVRSSANINNGAKTSWSNFFHGAFLLIFVAFFPMLIHKIPLAALAAMLVFTGFRLASPKEFSKTFKIGPEQLFIFCVTIFFTLYEDLLVGIFAGIIAKFVVELVMGVKPKNVFKAEVDIIDQGDDRIVIKLHGSAVFSNWLGIKRKLLAIEQGKHLQIDLSECKLVDHSAMDNLHMFESNYRATGGHCHIIGLDTHKPLSKHPLAVRIKPKVS